MTKVTFSQPVKTAQLNGDRLPKCEIGARYYFREKILLSSGELATVLEMESSGLADELGPKFVPDRTFAESELRVKQGLRLAHREFCASVRLASLKTEISVPRVGFSLGYDRIRFE